MLLLLSLAAFATPPDKQVGNLAVGTAQIERFTLSPDGRFLAGRDAKEGEESAWVLDLETWEHDVLAPCRVAGIAVRPVDAGTPELTDDYAELWIACSDGTLQLKQWEDGIVYDVQTSEEDTSPFTVQIDDGLTGAWYSAVTDRIYALSFAGDERQLHEYSPSDGTTDTDTGFPVALPTIDGYGTLLEGNLSYDGSQLIIAHGDERVSTVNLATGTLITDTGFFLIAPNDVTPSLYGIYAVDDAGHLAEYTPPASQWTYLTSLDVSDLDAQAVVANLVEDDEWLVVFGDRVRVWLMTNGGFPSSEPYWESGDLLNVVHDGLAYDSYVFGGGEGGGLRIITARPWIEPTTTTVTPTTAVAGETVNVGFTVDEDADWTVRLNGDRTGTGRALASGSAQAGVPVSVDIAVGAQSDWVEGINSLYVIATGAGGITGHAVASLTVDNPPTRPALGDDALGFTDHRLLLGFRGIHDEDLDHYVVYVSDTAFTADEWPSGGPTDHIRGNKYPIEVAAEPGAYVEQEIFPLQNEVPYWVAVRAVDAGGKESPMSRVLSESPRPGLNAAEQSGEMGGGPCSTGGAGGGPLAIALAGWAALRRRRAAGVAIGLLASGAAAAADGPEPFWEQHDLGRQYGTFELRYQSLQLDDPDLNDIFDQGSFGGLNLQIGPQWKGIVELEFGLGLIQKKAFTEPEGEEVDSTESTLLTMLPLNIDLGLRLQILDEQILVPEVKIGIDDYSWSQKTQRGDDLHPVFDVPTEQDFAESTSDTSTSAPAAKEKLTGWNLGMHYAIAGQLLLDVFAPARASLLEAQTGVNDTFLTFEYRHQSIDNRKVPWQTGGTEGFTFTGSSVVVGLKLDY